MRKTQKKVLGLFGLSIVAAVTAVAIITPGPKTSAISTMTDRIVVRVIGAGPNVDLSGVTNGATYVHPGAITVDYENISSATVTVEYTNIDGEKIEKVIDEFTPGQNVGSRTYDIFGADADLLGAGFGYGRYVLKVKGIGNNNVQDEDLVSFDYVPLAATLTEDEDTGKYYVELDYDADDGTDAGNGKVAELIINVYDGDGNLVTDISPIIVTPPTTKVEIPLAGAKLPTSEYTIRVTPYDRDKVALYTPSDLEIDYEAVEVPDTGGLFKNINISKEDYLISGLLIFFVFAIVGFGIVARSGRSNSKKRK